MLGTEFNARDTSTEKERTEHRQHSCRFVFNEGRKKKLRDVWEMMAKQKRKHRRGI